MDGNASQGQGQETTVAEAAQNEASTSDAATPPGPAPKRFRYVQTTWEDDDNQAAVPILDTGELELQQYLINIRSLSKKVQPGNVLEFWQSQSTQYPNLANVALDLISAPASQAYVERTFSTCGILTSARRNRMSTNLEMRVFLKQNKEL